MVSNFGSTWFVELDHLRFGSAENRTGVGYQKGLKGMFGEVAKSCSISFQQLFSGAIRWELGFHSFTQNHRLKLTSAVVEP